MIRIRTHIEEISEEVGEVQK